MLRTATLIAIVSLLCVSAFDETSLLQVKQEVQAGIKRSTVEAKDSLDDELDDEDADEVEEEAEELDTQQAAQKSSASAAWKSAVKAQIMQRLRMQRLGQQMPRQQKGNLTYKQAQLQRMAFGNRPIPHGQKLFSQGQAQAAHAKGSEWPKVVPSEKYENPDVGLSLPQQQMISYGMEVQTAASDSLMPMLSAVLGLPDAAFTPPDSSWGPISGRHQPVLANTEMGKAAGMSLGYILGDMLTRQLWGPREADYAPYGYAPSYYANPSQYYWPHYGYQGTGWVNGVSMPYYPAPLPRVNPYANYGYGYPGYGSIR